MRLKHLLVPTDFGPASERATAVALELASTLGAKITLLHVWSPPLPAYAEGIELPIASLETAAQEALDDACARLKAKHPAVAGLLEMGVAWDRIVETAKKHDVDMIVMGTHGRRGVPRWFLGSVAEKVVRVAPVPVVTVGADAT